MSDSASAVWVLGGWRAVTGLAADAGGVGKKPGGDPLPEVLGGELFRRAGEVDDGRLFRFAPADTPRPYRRIPITPVLDWSAWNVQADPVTEVTTAPGTGWRVRPSSTRPLR